MCGPNSAQLVIQCCIQKTAYYLLPPGGSFGGHITNIIYNDNEAPPIPNLLVQIFGTHMHHHSSYQDQVSSKNKSTLVHVSGHIVHPIKCHIRFFFMMWKGTNRGERKRELFYKAAILQNCEMMTCAELYIVVEHATCNITDQQGYPLPHHSLCRKESWLPSPFLQVLA